MNVASSTSVPVVLRKFRAADTQPTRQVYYDAVLGGTGTHYTRGQKVAWAGSRTAPPGWTARLSEQETIVATNEGRIVGFMSMSRTGYLDLAFVLPDFMGAGVSGKLYHHLETWAKTRGLQKLTTEASHLARPFFLRHGWRELAAQSVERRGQHLENFRMEKVI